MGLIISDTTVRRIAHFARLKLTDEEVTRFATELSEIVSSFEKLTEINTENVPPTIHPLSIRNVFRDDVAAACLDSTVALRNTAKRSDHFFKVSQTLPNAKPIPKHVQPGKLS